LQVLAGVDRVRPLVAADVDAEVGKRARLLGVREWGTPFWRMQSAYRTPCSWASTVVVVAWVVVGPAGAAVAARRSLGATGAKDHDDEEEEYDAQGSAWRTVSWLFVRHTSIETPDVLPARTRVSIGARNLYQVHGLWTPALPARSPHLFIAACRMLIPLGVPVEGMRVVSMSGESGLGSGKFLTPWSRMHCAKPRAACCCSGVRCCPVKPAGSRFLHASSA